MHMAGDVDFSRATAFAVDEFVGLDRNHPGSFHRFLSEQLLAGAEEATITHGDQVYRLRRTLTGKLILTK